MAESYFVNLGLEVVEKNFRTREGEIDLIVRDGQEIVFVEVKTRTSSSFGYPEEAVTEEKMAHLTAAAEKYLEKHPEIDSWRMDVLAIIGRPGKGSPQFEWYKNVE
jgi:putative endonuclease